MKFIIGGEGNLKLKKISLDISKLTEGSKSKISNLFSKLDTEVKKEEEIKNLTIVFKAKPTEEDLMKGKKRLRRKVFVENKEKKEEEEKLFSYLFKVFSDIHKKHGQSMAKIGEIFMKVSGDVQALQDFYEKKKVT